MKTHTLVKGVGILVGAGAGITPYTPGYTHANP